MDDFHGHPNALGLLSVSRLSALPLVFDAATPKIHWGFQRSAADLRCPAFLARAFQTFLKGRPLRLPLRLAPA
jgi:hypothetical protein